MEGEEVTWFGCVYCNSETNNVFVFDEGRLRSEEKRLN